MGEEAGIGVEVLMGVRARAAGCLGTSHRTVRLDASWVCRNEALGNSGTLGGAEGSQKGSEAATEGCSGMHA